MAVVLLVVASGCLFKPPAQVTFSVDKTSVYPGGIFHIIVTINNTGKVGITGVTLVLSRDDFRILQEPEFPKVLKVGEATQLIWVVQAPEKPGIYSLQVSLEIKDELKRTWTGFYGNFRITVTKQNLVPAKIGLEVNASKEVRGGEVVQVVLKVRNEYESPIKIFDVKISPLPGMEIRPVSQLPITIDPHDQAILKYNISTPYAYREGFVSVIVHYTLGTSRGTSITSFPLKVIWKPWEASREDLLRAYGEYYNILRENRIVDGYWEDKFNSTSAFEASFFKPIATAIVENASSEYDAALKLYQWINALYPLSENTTTLDPGRIFRKEAISPTEEQILLTAFLRSLNIPARVVSLFDGDDCTLRPITEFYTADGWYIVDVKHSFIGTLDEYIASPYFPRIYQTISQENYRIVAQMPEDAYLHEHEDVTADFTVNLDSRIYGIIRKRLHPQLVSKLDMVLAGLSEEERLYALFLFASAPNDELNIVLSTKDVDTIQKTIKALYEFYWDVPWKDDFSAYWEILRG